MNTYLLVENASKAFGDILLFDNITLVINEGQKIALIGRNGSGKTTLLNILSELDTFDDGSFYINKDLKIGYLPQDPRFDPQSTILQAIFNSQSEILSVVRDYELALLSSNHKQQ